MKKLILIIPLALLLFSCAKNLHQQNKKSILGIMKAQEKAWSNNDLEGFMQGYWKSDSLKFYGSSGLNYGWQKTLDNYLKSYPTEAHTGKLHFVIDDITQLSKNVYSVMGQYYLKRSLGDANGFFMIIFKKIDGEWKIVADTSV